MSVSLTGCEREQLHRSSAIQPHGCLAVTTADGTVTHVSTNAGAMLGDGAIEPGAHLPDADAHEPADGGPGARLAVPGDEAQRAGFDLIVTRGTEGTMVFEWIPDDRRVPAPREAGEDIGVVGPGSRDALVARIARMTGFQRVMYYAFREDGDGEVTAETLEDDAYGSYLGLRFPAHDIPQIARDLYVRNPWRLIPDARAEPIEVRGPGEVPDLTWSDLRSVSPVHREYMANMGVRAAVSFPVVVAGELAALVSAHHRDAHLPSLQACEAAAALTRVYSRDLTTELAEERMRLLDNLEGEFEALRRDVLTSGSLGEALPRWADRFLETFDAAGFMYEGPDETTLDHGLTLEPGVRRKLLQWLDGRYESGEVQHIDSLVRAVPGMGLSEVAGVLAIRLSFGGGRHGHIVFTRGEHLHEVAWGGAPEPPLDRGDGALTIAPRRSFETWIERRVGHCRSWDLGARLAGLRMLNTLRRVDP